MSFTQGPNLDYDNNVHRKNETLYVDVIFILWFYQIFQNINHALGNQSLLAYLSIIDFLIQLPLFVSTKIT